MKLSKNAEAIYKDMENKYSRCITRVYEKKYFQAGLDGYTITAYKEAIDNAYNSDCITKDEAVHLLKVLKCYLISISKLLEESEVMSYA
jgi:hypothetical protein